MLGLKTQMRVIKQLIRHWHGTLRGPSGLDEAYWQLFFNGSMLQDSDSLFTTCILPSGLVPSGHTLLIHLTGYDFDVDEELNTLVALTGR